jgi:hypothetical protein
MAAIINLSILRLSPGSGWAGAVEGATEELIGSIVVAGAPLITIAATPLVFDIPPIMPAASFGAVGAASLPYLAVSVLSGAILFGMSPAATPPTRLLLRAGEPVRLFALRGTPRVALVEASTSVTIPPDAGEAAITFNGQPLTFNGQPVTFGA